MIDGSNIFIYPGEQLVYEQLLGRNNFMSRAELTQALPDELYYVISELCRSMYANGLVIARYSVDGMSIAVGQAELPAYAQRGPEIHRLFSAIGVNEQNWTRVTKAWGAVLTQEWTPSYLPEGVVLAQPYVDPGSA